MITGDRYVVLGLGRPRSAWFRDVAAWSTAASLPAEFLKCVSAEELRARLRSGRPHSAMLVDGSLPAVDRDLLELARATGCAVLVVDDGSSTRDWPAIGAAVVVPATLTREVLLDALGTHAEPVDRRTVAAFDDPDLDGDVPGRGLLVAVCGPGGTGASTVAACVAQGLATGARHREVLLADLARNAEQAMLHDVRDVVPGVQELVEAHRSRRPDPDELRALTFHVLERRYFLLIGLRRSRYWSTLRPRAFDVAFDSLRRTFGAVVADVTADFESEADGGSADVEERNHLARSSTLAADAVLAVGRPGMKGLHSLVRVLADLGSAGVPAGRIVPVFNQAPRHPRARAELTAALAELAEPALGGGRTVNPVFLPVRKVEEALRDVVALPAPLPELVSSAVEAVVAQLGPAASTAVPELVQPGSLGGFEEIG